MTLTTDVITLANNKKFTEFSNQIKDRLNDLYNSNSVIASLSQEKEHIRNMKNSFSNIVYGDKDETNI